MFWFLALKFCVFACLFYSTFSFHLSSSLFTSLQCRFSRSSVVSVFNKSYYVSANKIYLVGFVWIVCIQIIFFAIPMHLENNNSIALNEAVSRQFYSKLRFKHKICYLCDCLFSSQKIKPYKHCRQNELRKQQKKKKVIRCDSSSCSSLSILSSKEVYTNFCWRRTIFKHFSCPSFRLLLFLLPSFSI